MGLEIMAFSVEFRSYERLLQRQELCMQTGVFIAQARNPSWNIGMAGRSNRFRFAEESP
jgi:hypothetical protein